MANVHARAEEAKFYALEQKSLLRDNDAPLPAKLFSELYWLASDYGQNLLRPIFGVLAIFVIFSIIYLAFIKIHLDSDLNGTFLATHAESVLRFSLQQVFQPFELFRDRHETGIVI